MMSSLDKFEEQVDPRVQIELERLNAATDDINKLELDLDDARAGFRQLLCESTVRIENLSKKLGSCVEKARPYYEARIKSKEALQETQKAALRFERANSAHAAAKEMVYLAEEGLTAEGRTFDHAWQEMLNHATMRVNESELERTLSEAHHKRTSLIYHTNETKVQQLQKELKRSIAKSRPYFEAKAQFNRMLEEQKQRVKALEKKVANAKTSYAEALRNLEQISDEMHRIRKSIHPPGMDPLGVSNLANVTSPEGTTPSTSTNQETDQWTDSTGSPDSDYVAEEYLQLPDKLGPAGSPTLPYQRYGNNGSYRKLENKSNDTSPGGGDERGGNETEGRSPDNCSMETRYSRMEEEEEEEEGERGWVGVKGVAVVDQTDRGEGGGKGSVGAEWSEISLSPRGSPPLSQSPPPSQSQPQPSQMVPIQQQSPQPSHHQYHHHLHHHHQRARPDLVAGGEAGASSRQARLATWISRVEGSTQSRRQSLDTLISGSIATNVKEILSQGIMRLNISSLTERRGSEPKVAPVAGLSSAAKKAPSPLEKTMGYLNTEDTDYSSASDTESLASVEMLTDDQISSLMLDQEIQEAYNDLMTTGTPSQPTPSGVVKQ